MDISDDSVLLEQHDFLRRLARGLTHDHQAADDLAQETWLQALRKPPRHADSPRGWLAAIARNVARNEGRADLRRRDREARVAHDADATVDERAERVVELQGEVVQALGRLSEPMRTVVVLRYFEDRSPAAIAEELDLPIETVRSRLKRGLARLREDLDRRHGGDRSAWSVPLLAFAEPATRATAVGAGAASGGAWLVAIAALFVAVVVAAASLLRGEEDAGVADRIDESTVARAAAETPDLDPGASESEAASSAVVESTGSRTEAVAARSDDEAVVRGRLVDVNGAPISGAPITLGAFPLLPPTADIQDVRDGMLELEATTESDGSFEFRVAVDGRFQGGVMASRSLHVTARFDPVVLTAGADLHVGERPLVPGGALGVRLTNADGEPLAESGWNVRVRSNVAVQGRARRGLTVSETLDATTGTTVVDGLPAGPVRLTIWNPLFEDQIERDVDVVLGEETELAVVHDGPPANRCLAVMFSSRLRALQPAVDFVRLDADGEERRLTEHRGLRPFRFTDLEPGSYRVECTDPRFLPWSATLETGRQHEVTLIGAASVRLEVVDAATGAAIVPRFLKLDLSSAPFSPSVFVALARGAEPPAGGLFDDIVPGSYAYELETDEYGTSRGRIDALAAGPARTVRIELGADIPGLVGRIVTVPDGDPVVGADVHLTAGERAGHLMGPNGTMRDQIGVVPPVDASTTTDASGRFRFPDITAGVHTLRLQRGPWFRVDRTLTIDPASGDEVLFELAEGATVRGRALVPDGFDATKITIEAVETDGEGFGPAMGPMGMQRVALAEDGSFEIGPFTSDVWTLGFGLAGPELTIPGRGISRPGDWSRFHDEDVTVIDGQDRELTVDLRQRVPAELSIDLDGGDAGPSDVRPWIWNLDTDRGVSQRRRSFGNGSRSSTGDVLRVGAVKPGRYRVVLFGRDGRWAYVDDDEITLGVAEERTVAIEVELERRTLVLRDAATDAPLDDVDVEWSLGLPGDRSLSRRKKPWRTNSDGEAAVVFPPSVVEIAVSGYIPETIEWPIGDADEIVVRLTRE